MVLHRSNWTNFSFHFFFFLLFLAASSNRCNGAKKNISGWKCIRVKSMHTASKQALEGWGQEGPISQDLAGTPGTQRPCSATLSREQPVVTCLPRVPDQHHSPVSSPTCVNLNLITRKQTHQAVEHSRKWPRLLNVSVLWQGKAEDTPRLKTIKETRPPNARPPNATCDSDWTLKQKVEGKDRIGTDWVASLVAQMVKRMPAMRETWVWFLGQEDPLRAGEDQEKEMAIHSSTLVWKIPWMEEPDSSLQSMGSQRVRHDWATSLSL